MGSGNISTIMMNLEPYLAGRARWPVAGRHILADYDAESVVVYQAYHPGIALPAARDGRFGARWSRTRMTWIKPGFLWMMYRSGWATKENQEAVLRIRLQRSGFDEILKRAVHSSYVPEVYGTREAWDERVARSEVRLQWDPDHHPSGAKEERRAIQLGIRGGTLASFADDWIIGIEDITPFVREQHAHVVKQAYRDLMLPREEPYPVSDAEVAAKLGITGDAAP
ncbi:Hypothetical protein A7982_11212 [Minicystis rosea]|nr:Hypothetical protein A7982_11212 [Minicystis rosea]